MNFLFKVWFVFMKKTNLRTLRKIELKVFFSSVLKRSFFDVVIRIIKIFVRFIKLIQLIKTMPRSINGAVSISDPRVLSILSPIFSPHRSPWEQSKHCTCTQSCSWQFSIRSAAQEEPAGHFVIALKPRLIFLSWNSFPFSTRDVNIIHVFIH